MANKLTFTGASSQTYDGSTAVTINIPITADISKGLMGINLLKYTRDLSNFVNQSHVNNKICTSGNGELIQTTDGIKLNFKGNNYACIYVPVSDYTIKSGVVYTISFEYRGTITTFGGVWFERSSVGNLNVASNPVTLVNNTTTWQKCRFTVITSAAIARDTTVFWLGLFYGVTRASTDWIEIKKGSLKMERGNIAAPVWTPSLEEDPNYDITSIVQPSQFNYLAAWVDTELRAINPSSITVGKASSADKVNHKLSIINPNQYHYGWDDYYLEYDGSKDLEIELPRPTGAIIYTNNIWQEDPVDHSAMSFDLEMVNKSFIDQAGIPELFTRISDGYINLPYTTIDRYGRVKLIEDPKGTQARIRPGTGISFANKQISLATSGVTAGTYGSATAVPQLTIDAYGRITEVTNVNVATRATIDILYFNAAFNSSFAGAQSINLGSAKKRYDFYILSIIPSIRDNDYKDDRYITKILFDMYNLPDICKTTSDYTPPKSSLSLPSVYDITVAYLNPTSTDFTIASREIYSSSGAVSFYFYDAYTNKSDYENDNKIIPIYIYGVML